MTDPIPVYEVLLPQEFKVRVGWIVPNKRGGYSHKSKAYCIHAMDLLEACKVAVDRHKANICAAIECCWATWPKETK